MGVKETVAEIRALLQEESNNCLWNGAKFATSSYVYISKKGLQDLSTLLVRVSEFDAGDDLERKEAADVKARLLNAVEEINTYAEDNHNLRAELQRLYVSMHGKDAWALTLKSVLGRLRRMFGGNVTIEELNKVLKDVDEVLAQ